MPELPEVETIRIALCNELLNEKIKSVQIKNNKLRYPVSRDFQLNLKDIKVKKILRRGKFLVFFLEHNISFICHLGMTGTFRIQKKYYQEKHDHVIFFLSKNVIVYNDVRKFGFLKIEDSRKVLTSKHIKNLGIEPLDKNFDSSFLENQLKQKKHCIKTFLMNQKNIAGLGNIYCSEILFDSYISPKRLSYKLKKIEIERLVFSTKKIINSAIRKGGTTIQNYLAPEGKIGYFQNNLKVYGRSEKSCPRCCDNVKIKKILIQGRSTFFCKKCQK